ncbi:MAG: hypothetical protein KAG34_06660 [Cocleimonas sp.]|nr:hypothetical protein [Cocleimonas sp.]
MHTVYKGRRERSINLNSNATVQVELSRLITLEVREGIHNIGFISKKVPLSPDPDITAIW